MEDNNLKIIERKGLPRTNLPINLPEKVTWLKQPNIVTQMSYDYQIIQLKALICIIERLQTVIKSAINKDNPSSQLTLFEDIEEKERFIFDIPLKDFGIATNNYDKLRASLKQLVSIPIELDYVDPETGDRYTHLTNLMEAYIPEKFERNVRLVIYKKVINILLSIDKGFSSFIKEIAFNARSKYTIRFYMLISSWKDRGGFTITYTKLRKWLDIGAKYDDYKDFYRFVVRPAYEELFEKSDVWFEVSEVYNKGEKKPIRLNFKVVKGKLSAQEEQQLNTYRLSIENMLVIHLGMDLNHIRNITRLVTIENYQAMVQKISYLKDYLPGRKIRDLQKYCVRAFREDFDHSLAGEELNDIN